MYSVQLLVCLLFYAMATIFQLHHVGDMMYEMRRRKPKPILLPIQGIFNLLRYLGMVWEELAFADSVSYSQGEIDCSADSVSYPQGGN